MLCIKLLRSIHSGVRVGHLREDNMLGTIVLKVDGLMDCVTRSSFQLLSLHQPQCLAGPTALLEDNLYSHFFSLS